MLKIPIISEFDGKGFNKAYKEFNQLKSSGDKMSFALKAGMASAAAGVAALGAAAYKAGQMFLDFAKMAGEDQTAQLRLAQSIKGSTKATAEQIKGVEQWIDRAQRLTGVADDKLRPAFARLVRSTRSITESTKLMRISLDVAAATGKDVETVANALAKAHDGQNTALMRLGLGFTKAQLKAMTFDETMGKLETKFSGSALEQANTYAGAMARFSVAANELKESLGYAILPALTRLAQIAADVATAFGDKGMAGAIAEFKFQMSSLMYDANGQLNQVGKTIDELGKKWNLFAQIANKFKPESLIGGPVFDIANQLSGGRLNITPSVPSYGGVAPSVNPSQFRTIRGAQSTGNTIYIQTGLGDPVAIGREVYNVLQRLERRGGGRAGQ